MLYYWISCSRSEKSGAAKKSCIVICFSDGRLYLETVEGVVRCAVKSFGKKRRPVFVRFALPI
ncbi:MAG: hypothetical protein IJZ24_01175 [Clostridia bacterium]|nr:hypothetical protein [Clostridia bacterium]